MEKLATQLLNSLSTWIKNNPGVVNSMLLSGGAGALLGAAVPGSSDDKEESASDRVKRRIRNALIGGALGAGGAGLLGYGLSQFSTAIPENEPTTGESIANIFTNPWSRAGYGAGALSTTALVTRKMRSNARKNLVRDMGLEGASKTNANKIYKAYAQNPSKFVDEAVKHLPFDPNVTRQVPVLDAKGNPVIDIVNKVIGKKKGKVLVKQERIPRMTTTGTKPAAEYVANRLAKMNVFTSPTTRGKIWQAVKGNALRGGIGSALTGAAVFAPEIISWFTGD